MTHSDRAPVRPGHIVGANALEPRGLRDLAAMDVTALMEVVATRDQLPVVTTATVLSVEQPIAHEHVGAVYPVTLDVDATETSSDFVAHTSVTESVTVPQVGDRLSVTFRVDAPPAVAVIGPA